MTNIADIPFVYPVMDINLVSGQHSVTQICSTERAAAKLCNNLNKENQLNVIGVLKAGATYYYVGAPVFVCDDRIELS